MQSPYIPPASVKRIAAELSIEAVREMLSKDAQAVPATERSHTAKACIALLKALGYLADNNAATVPERHAGDR